MKLILQLRTWLYAITSLLLAIVFSLPVFAQNSQVVQGLILDEQRQPIEGATVQVKASSISTSTDRNGRFSLSVPSGSRVLVVTFVGKSPQEATLGNQNSLTITLKNATTDLEDVVVVGYSD